jgi:polysaccharide biosynthesis/export protein
MDALRLPLAHSARPSLAQLVRSWTARALCLALLAFLPACGGTDQHSTELVARKSPGPAVLSPGDTLRLTFRKAPELNQTARVRPDGRVALWQVGTVKAAGKSVDSLQSELASRYELKSPSDLTISLESTYIAVYVTGAVGKPGKVVLDRPMTLLEVIMESGGFDRETANLKRVSLTRLVNGKYVTRRIDMRDPAAGVEYVQPYDMIEVGRYFQ